MQIGEAIIFTEDLVAVNSIHPIRFSRPVASVAMFVLVSAMAGSVGWSAEVEKPHPLDPALEIARNGLERINKNVRDYTCTMIKRERIGGKLGEHQFIFMKIRHRQEENGQVKVPFSVYLKFLRPKSVEGREVIWVEGRNEGKLVAHEPGLLNIKRVWLDPKGTLAMYGQRYPIYEIGMKNLIEELIEQGTNDRKYGECEVKFFEGAKVDQSVCQMIQVIHPVRRPHFEFYKAQIFIDTTLDVPVRYASWSWPESKDGDPRLEEEYTYIDVKLNVGLTDIDFDPANESYNYPNL